MSFIDSDAHHRSAESENRQPTDACLFHRGQRRMHVVFRIARRDRLSWRPPRPEVGGARILRRQGDVHVSIGDDTDELSIVHHGQNAAVAVPHQLGAAAARSCQVSRSSAHVVMRSFTFMVVLPMPPLLAAFGGLLDFNLPHLRVRPWPAAER